MKVEQLQEKEDEKEQEMMRPGGGVLLWTEEDHPLVSLCSKHSLTQVLASWTVQQKRADRLPGPLHCCC